MHDTELLDLMVGGSIILILFISIFALSFLVIYTVGLWKLFKKAGKNGWEALIPFYNTYVLIEISGLNWWYFLLAISGTIVSILNLDSLSWLVGIASCVANFFTFYNLGKKMHKDPTKTALLGTFLPGIMLPILGLSKNYEYDNSVEVSLNGPVGENNNSTYNNGTSPERFCLGCGIKLKPNSSFCENCGRKVD